MLVQYLVYGHDQKLYEPGLAVLYYVPTNHIYQPILTAIDNPSTYQKSQRYGVSKPFTGTFIVIQNKQGKQNPQIVNRAKDAGMSRDDIKMLEAAIERFRTDPEAALRRSLPSLDLPFELQSTRTQKTIDPQTWRSVAMGTNGSSHHMVPSSYVPAPEKTDEPAKPAILIKPPGTRRAISDTTLIGTDEAEKMWATHQGGRSIVLNQGSSRHALNMLLGLRK